MLEQAGMALLRLPQPARRRFSLLMTIAAHRYQKTGPVGRMLSAVRLLLSDQDFASIRKSWQTGVVVKRSLCSRP